MIVPFIRRSALTLVLAFATTGAGCPANTVTIPISDPTPPQAGLNIGGFVKNFIVTSDTGSMSYEGGANEVGVIATGTDTDGGVASLKLTARFDLLCGRTLPNGLGQTQAAYGEPFTDMLATQNGHPGETVKQELALGNKIDMHKLVNSCTTGWTFVSLELDITAVTTNFSNLTSSVTFTDRYP